MEASAEFTKQPQIIAGLFSSLGLKLGNLNFRRKGTKARWK
jgi:hypothetical protein